MSDGETDPKLQEVVEAIENVLEEPSWENRLFVVVAVKKFLHPSDGDEF